MVHGQMSAKPSKFGIVLIRNIKDMGSFLLVNYRDPKKTNNKEMKFKKLGVDIALSSWCLIWLV